MVAIHGEEKGIVSQVLPYKVPEVGEVVRIAVPHDRPPRSVLVLHLHHEDGAARLHHERFHPRQELVEPLVDPVEEARVGRSKLDPLLGQEPGREAAEVPLGVHVGPRAEDDEEVALGGERYELLHVGLIREAVRVRLRLVETPVDVDLDGVEARRANLPQPVQPLTRVEAKVVDGARDVAERLPVQHERVPVEVNAELVLRVH